MRALTRIGLVLVAAALAALLGEGLLRALPESILHPPLAGYPWMQRDAVFGMVNVPGHFADPPFGGGRLTGIVDINELGLRGRSLEQPRRRPRVVCLGDSSTFGIHLVEGVAGDPQSRYAADNAYPERLAALMDAEVVNAGVIGYNSGHGLRQLRGRVLPRLRPDVTADQVVFGPADRVHLAPAGADVIAARVADFLRQ